MTDDTELPQTAQPNAPAATPHQAGQLPASPKPRRAPRWAVLGMAVLLMIAGLGLVGLAVWQSLNPKPRTALEILDAVRAEVIPAEGSATTYGIAFSKAGYDALISWKDRYPVNSDWAADYEALDITLPCCGVGHPFADETKNCGCGHHQALYGLAKKLLTDGQDRASAQAEVTRWVGYLYPKETLQAERQRRAVTDPAVNQALQELIEKGEC